MTVNAMMFVPPIDSAETRLTPLEKTPNIATLPAFGPFRDNATVYVPRGGSVIHPRPDHRAANTSMKAGSSPGGDRHSQLALITVAAVRIRLSAGGSRIRIIGPL